jgi:hypothetical protein
MARIGLAVGGLGTKQRRRAAIVCAALAATLALVVPALAVTFDGWTPAHSMGTARLFHVQVTLANGNVLVAGGQPSLSSGTALKSTEIYNPSADSWFGAPDMGTARVVAVAAKLPGGKVLVAGGSTTGNSADNLATAEVYDPASNTWTPTANNMSSPRGLLATATALPSGQVLVAGGSDATGTAVKTADLYNPATNSFTPAHDMGTARTAAAASLLASGKVLVAGGLDVAGNPLATGEVYDPTTNAWTPVGNSMSVPHGLPVAATVPGGKVIVTGGESATSPSTVVTANSDLYDPATNAFTGGPAMGSPRVLFAGTSLADGRLLVTGGANIGGGSAVLVGSTEIYDVTSNRWTTVGSLGTARVVLAASTLTNGQVLATGGTSDVTTSSASTTAELFTPAAPPGVPQSVTATAGNGSATVSFAPPASDGGSPVTRYTVKASTGQVVTTPDARTVATVPGLTNGRSVSFTVTATNAFGTGPASAASNAVTPAGPDTAASVSITGLAKKLKLKSFLKGVKFSVTPSKAASLEISLLGKVRKATISKAGSLTLASKTTRLSASTQKLKLKPKKKLVGRPRKATIQVVIVATDAAGTRSTTTKKIKISR